MKKRPLLTRNALLVLLTLLSGCGPRHGQPDAGPALALALVDAGTRLGLKLQVEAKLSDGGLVRADLDPVAAPLLPVTQALNVTVNRPLHNYRLRILDELDRALASDDTPEETATELSYRIALLSPLRAGHRYTVLLDAERGATFDDGSGLALDERRFEFRTEGEREREAPAKRSPSKRHHRRNDGT